MSSLVPQCIQNNSSLFNKKSEDEKVAFLVFSGIFTWLYGGSDVFFVGQASMQAFFAVSFWTLFFFIPALTMRLLAEEKKAGTIELLLTKGVSDRQVVLGKFFACFLLIAITLAFTLPYYIQIAGIGNIDHGAVWCGYLGLLLMSAAYIGIGIFASSTTNNQIVAFLLALFISIFFHWLFGMLSSMGGFLGTIFDTLNLQNHYESITRGVIDTKDLIYFLSIAALGVFLAEYNISNRG